MEFVFVLGLFVFVMWGGFQLVDVVITRQRMLAAAHFGTQLQGIGLLSSEQVHTQLLALTNQWGEKSAQWKIETGRFLDHPSAQFNQLVKTEIRVPLKGSSQYLYEKVVVQKAVLE